MGELGPQSQSEEQAEARAEAVAEREACDHYLPSQEDVDWVSAPLIEVGQARADF